MSYDLSGLQNQLQNVTRQYQQLTTQIPPQTQSIQPSVYPIPAPAHIQLPTPPRQVQYVEGIAGARLYQQNELPPNSSEIIMDKDDNILYMVSKDANGTPSKKIKAARFTIEELEEEEPAFLTRKDLDDFKEEIRQLFAQSQSKTQWFKEE